VLYLDWEKRARAPALVFRDPQRGEKGELFRDMGDVGVRKEGWACIFMAPSRRGKNADYRQRGEEGALLRSASAEGEKRKRMSRATPLLLEEKGRGGVPIPFETPA